MNFTDSYLERLMKQRPVDRRPKGCEPPPEGHPCHGCGNASKPCLLPCWKLTQKTIDKRKKMW